MLYSLIIPSRLLVRLYVLLYLSSSAYGILHYYSESGSKKCFYKELNKGSLLIGRYKLDIRDFQEQEFFSPRDKTNTGVLIDVEEAFDADHRVVHQKGLSSGQFTFIALESGEHRICLTPRSFLPKKWYGNSNNEPALADSKFTEARVMLDLLIGDSSAIDSKHSDGVKTLSEKVTKLNDKLTDIKREQLFIREKEMHFRDQSERTCDKVLRWSIIQSGALLIVCVYQVLSLSRFFIKEKIA